MNHCQMCHKREATRELPIRVPVDDGRVIEETFQVCGLCDSALREQYHRLEKKGDEKTVRSWLLELLKKMAMTCFWFAAILTMLYSTGCASLSRPMPEPTPLHPLVGCTISRNQATGNKTFERVIAIGFYGEGHDTYKVVFPDRYPKKFDWLPMDKKEFNQLQCPQGFTVGMEEPWQTNFP